MELNPLNWNWNSAKAAGRHGLTAAGSVLATLVALRLIKGADSATILTSLNQIVDGLEKVVEGIGGLVGLGAGMYAAWKAANSATPKEQMKSVVTNLTAPEITQAANAVDDPEGRNKLISAVADMPEVKKVVAVPSVAANTPSEKVVMQ